jgi:phage terminase small subunit
MAKRIKLNDANNIFIDEYISNGGFGSRAYEKAYGHNASTNAARSGSSQLLNDPLIQNEIQKRREEIRERSNIKKEDIVNHLLQLIEDCKTDKDKNHLIKALDMLNKMNGLYQNNLDITSGGEKITINIDLGL